MTRYLYLDRSTTDPADGAGTQIYETDGVHHSPKSNLWTLNLSKNATVARSVLLLMKIIFLAFSTIMVFQLLIVEEARAEAPITRFANQGVLYNVKTYLAATFP